MGVPSVRRSRTSSGAEPMPLPRGWVQSQGSASLAGGAAAARRRPGQDDEVALPERVRRHVRAERLDDGGSLVTEHDVRRSLPLAVDDMEVRVAHARGNHPNQHLAALRLVQQQILDLERAPGPAEHEPARAHCHGRCYRPRMPKGGPYGPPVGISSGSGYFLG